MAPDQDTQKELTPIELGTLLGPPANGTRKAEPRQEAGPFADLGPFRKRTKDYRALGRLTVRSASANSAAVVFALPWS